jgi:hypothetical protein
LYASLFLETSRVSGALFGKTPTIKPTNGEGCYQSAITSNSDRSFTRMKFLVGRDYCISKNRNLTVDESFSLYAEALSSLTFIEDGSIFTVASTAESNVLGNKGMDACLVSMFQRIKTQSDKSRANGMMFFDEGHKDIFGNFAKLKSTSQPGHQKAHGKTEV